VHAKLSMDTARLCRFASMHKVRLSKANISKPEQLISLF
jgi:hypothetical protein